MDLTTKLPNLGWLLNCIWTYSISSYPHGQFGAWVCHAYCARSLYSTVLCLRVICNGESGPRNSTEPQLCRISLAWKWLDVRVVATGEATSPAFFSARSAESSVGPTTSDPPRHRCFIQYHFYTQPTSWIKQLGLDHTYRMDLIQQQECRPR